MPFIGPKGPTTGRVVKYLPVPPVRSRGDEGIAPYANGKILPCDQIRLNISGVPSTPVPGFARSTLSKQERAKVFHSL